MHHHKIKSSVTAVILAAGESRRMGDRNKLLLPINGKTLVEHVVDAVTASCARETIVVLGHEAALLGDILSGRNVVLVENTAYRRGMTTSIQRGVRAATGAAHGFMICLSDQPLLRTSELDRLIGVFSNKAEGNKPIVVPDYRGRRGNPVIFSQAYRDQILNHPEPHGCKSLLKDNGQHVVRVAMDTDHVLHDIDRESDYLALIASRP